MKRKMFHVVDCLVIFTLVTLTVLDTFVFTRTYAQAEERSRSEILAELQAQNSSGTADAAEEDTEENTGLRISEESSETSEDESEGAGQSASEESADTGQEIESTGQSASEETAGTAQSDSEEAAGTEQSASEGSAAGSDPVITDTSYQDENISISIEEYRYEDSTIYVADVQVSSLEYLYAALAQNTYGKNVTAATSEIAEDNGAILAINGDYYGARNSGYVLRNGYLYRESTSSSDQEDLVIGSDGSFYFITEGSASAAELLNAGAWQVLSFGPALITDGEISVGIDEEVGRAMASNPRTAICEIEPLHYLLVVSDGRSDESEGLSLYQLAEFLQTLGVKNAYNLDGGGSSTMVFINEVVNNPTTTGKRSKERSVSDAICIGY